MASSLSNIAAKDGNAASVSGGILAVDKSGAGTGPFFAAQTLVDTQGVNTATIKAASTAPVGGDTALVVAISPNSVNPNGRAVPTSSAPVVLNSMTYTAVAASQSAALFGATGASGDYLDGVLIIPATAAAGAVSITDGSGSAITIFVGGGTTALPTLAPFYVPIGAISKGGAGGWKVTTGANVSVIGIGNFT
jgi:hypothetical protein